MKNTVNKSVRFSILKRDKFACRYCGARSPKALLEVDHIVPVSLGGSNDPCNLITSCRCCNRGKSNKPLGLSKAARIVRKLPLDLGYDELLEKLQDSEIADFLLG